jgi:hypothetical protein
MIYLYSQQHSSTGTEQIGKGRMIIIGRYARSDGAMERIGMRGYSYSYSIP